MLKFWFVVKLLFCFEKLLFLHEEKKNINEQDKKVTKLGNFCNILDITNNGGENGIRTRGGTISSSPVKQTSAFDHSAISPSFLYEVNVLPTVVNH